MPSFCPTCGWVIDEATGPASRCANCGASVQARGTGAWGQSIPEHLLHPALAPRRKGERGFWTMPVRLAGLFALVLAMCAGILGVILRPNSPGDGNPRDLRTDVDTFWTLTRANHLVVSADGTDQGLRVTVSNKWHPLHRQIRLQEAQQIHAAWARAHWPGEPDRARVKLVDLNGNEVGGTGALGGVWVQD